MGDASFQGLSTEDKRYALRFAQGRSDRRAHLLEKDIWVVQTLGVLFDAPFGADLVFKGGTSLAKGYDVIRRFSEDVDITYDIRAFAPDLATDAGEEALPPNRSQERKWSKAIRAQLSAWVQETALPIIGTGLDSAGFSARVQADGERLYIGYESVLSGDYGFVEPQVMVEFGARSTGEPQRLRQVKCDAAPFLPGLTFPTARPRIMLATRTFWEKATAAHVFCRQERRRGERLSRHWHDLVRLDDFGIATIALADRGLACSVARHKAMFFRERDSIGNWIDYEAAVSGGLQLVPLNHACEALADDYRAMIADGMLPDESETFETLIERCADIEARANDLEVEDG